MTTAVAAAPATEVKSSATWSQDYEHFQKNPPKEGTILRAAGTDELARLDIELVDGAPPFIYGRAYVPCIVGTPVGWFLQSASKNDTFGLKCILMPKARDELTRKVGLNQTSIGVKALRVLRQSKSGSSLLCEVAEY
jgi:hypothetical protein